MSEIRIVAESPWIETFREALTIVTKKLPIQNGEFEYRIKSVTEPFERVVRESELINVGD